MKENEDSENKRRRKRKIIWFNPPFNTTIINKIGKEFLDIINKNFPKNHKYNKIFNRNTLKLSYSCTQNIKGIITNHNNKLINNKPSTTKATCNCRVKNNCPMRGECLKSGLIYKASVTSGNNERTYIGSTKTTFKERYNNHKQSFKDENKKKNNNTKLAKYIWEERKKQKTEPIIKWETIEHAKAYSPGDKDCKLCTAEKLAILMNEKNNILNGKNDVNGKCLHRKFVKLKESRP